MFKKIRGKAKHVREDMKEIQIELLERKAEYLR